MNKGHEQEKEEYFRISRYVAFYSSMMFEGIKDPKDLFQLPSDKKRDIPLVNIRRKNGKHESKR